MRFAPAAAPARDARTPIDDILYDVEWITERDLPGSPAREVSGDWLIVSDLGGMGEDLASGIQAAGGHPRHRVGRQVGRGDSAAHRRAVLAWVVHLANLDLPPLGGGGSPGAVDRMG